MAASSSFVTVSGMFFRAFVPDVFTRMPYLKTFYGVGDFGQLGSGIGIVFGAYLVCFSFLYIICFLFSHGYFSLVLFLALKPFTILRFRLFDSFSADCW